MKHANIRTNVNVKRLVNIKRTIIRISNKGKRERQLMSDIIDEIQNQLTEEISKINNDIITQRAKSLSKNKRFDKNKNLFSKQRENKVSVINSQGTELFDPAAIIKEYQNEFIKRLSPRQMDQDYKGIEVISSRLFNIRLRISRGMNFYPDFNMKELEIVVKSLKNGKSTDPEGLINELFNYGGLSFKTVLLQLLNTIKNNKGTPESWNNILISTIYKKRFKKNF